MSAWIVDKIHIDLIVSAVANGTRDRVIRPRQADKNAIGQALVTECFKSVSYRYPQDAPNELPGPRNAYWLEPYVFSDPGYSLTAGELLQATACYGYQSCEHPGWRCSWAKELVDALEADIKEFLGADIKCSDDAPWGFDEDSVAELIAKQKPCVSIVNLN